MSERTREVRTFEIKLLCDFCVGGIEMEKTGRAHLIYPPEFEYRCSNCNHSEFHAKNYPQIVYKEI